MPGENFEIGAFIKLDGESQFKTAVSSVNNSLKGMKAEMAKVNEDYAGNLNSVEALGKKQEIYSRILEEQHRKIERVNEGLENSRRKYEEYGQKVERVGAELENAERDLEAMRAAGEASEEEIQQQEAAVEELRKALERAGDNYGKQEARIRAWEASLARAEAELSRMTNRSNENQRHLDEARRSIDQHSHSIDGNGRRVREATQATIKWGEAIKTSIAQKVIDTAIDALKDLGASAYENTIELEKAGNQLEASLDVSGAAVERYKGVLEDVYSNNYGDSLEDVGNTIEKTIHTLGELNGTELTNVTESAFALRDTFDMDLNETLRGTRSLMYQFGMSAEEAMDLMGSGAKAGLNYTDELGDNVSEYAGSFAQAGYSAQEYFQLLKNGTENGAYNLDKVNDAINEVTNKLADGSIEGALESFGEGTQNLFLEWQAGNATQKQVIDSIVSDISQCKNEQEALTMAATAFGTMGEDSNLKFVQSLTSMGNTFVDVRGQMEEIKNIKYDDLESRITQLTRQIQIQLGEQIRTLLPMAESGLEAVADNLVPIESALMGLGATITVVKITTSDMFMGAIASAKAYWISLGEANVATKLLATSTHVLNTAMRFLRAHWAAIAIGVGVCITVFAALTSSQRNVKNEAAEQAEEIHNLSEELKALKKSAEESKEAFEADKNKVEVDSSSIQVMSDRLYELAGSQQDFASKKDEMLAYVNNLNEAIPGLNLALDEQTGQLNMGKDAVDGYIASAKQAALMDVYGDRMAEVAGKIAEANKISATAATEKAEAETELKKVEAELAEIGEEGNETLRHSTYLTGQAETKADALKAKQAALKSNIEQSNGVIEEQGKFVEECKKEQEELGKEIQSTSDVMEGSTEVTQGNAKALKENAEMAKASSEAQKEALESLREKFEEIKSSIEQGMQEKISLFDAFDGGDTYNLDNMGARLEKQKEELLKWKENMQTLAREVGGSMSAELYDKLLELGPEYANFTQQLADCLDPEKGGSKEQLERIAKDYAEVFDITDSASEELARSQAMFKTVMGEMSNSTELDFSNLRESLEGAASAAAEGGEVISEELKKSFLDTVKAAEEMGAEIPEGLADKIASGDVSIGDAIAQLKGSMEAQFNFLSELAGEAGIEIDDEIRKGILNGGEDAVKAIAQLQEKILKKQEESEKEFKKGGKKNTEAVGAGTEEAKPEVVSKTGSVMQQSADTANSYYMQFRNVGSNMMSGVALGMTSNSNLVYDAVRRILEQAKKEADKATDSHSPSRVWRNQVGAYMSQGLALGISDGTKDVTSAATGLARSATKATKEELDINSPSKIFIKLGGYISEGLGIGIKNKKGYAVQTSKKMAKEVYKASAEWMEKYMSSHNVSLEGEKKFWKQLAKTVKKDSKSYKDALKHAAANDKFIKEVRGKVKDAFDVSWYTKKAKKTVKKDADKYYGEVTKAAKKFIDNKKAVDGTGLRQEKYFWEQVKKKAGKGTQTYADAAKRIKEINKDIKKQVKANAETKQEKKEYGVSGAGLELYKSLYKVSAQAEIDYWKKIRKNGKLTKAQKLEVDKNILEAEENFNEQMKALKDDYYEKCKDINDKLKDDIEELTEEYETAFADRKTAIKSAFGTFDEFSSEAEAPEVLLENMKSQAAGYALWIEQLGELEGKGILKSPFIEALRQMGPEAAATIMSLNMMTEEQLRQAQQAWDEKDKLAEAQAAKETEALRKKNEEQIKKLREEAQKQLDTYKAEYEAASAELSAAMSGPLEELAVKATTLGEKATAELILGMKDRAESKATKKELKEVRKEVASGLNGLPKKGKDIGGDMLAGLLSGLSNKLEITKGAKSFVEELEAAIKAAAGIHSPSRRFRDAVGKQIPAGVAQGVEEGTAEAERAGAGMVDSMLAKSAERMERQRAALKGYAEGLNGSAGIAALDNLTAPHLAQSTNITVNNTGVAEMLGGVTAEIQKLGGEIRRMKIMLDTGELVGAIGDELAMEARRA